MTLTINFQTILYAIGIIAYVAYAIADILYKRRTLRAIEFMAEYYGPDQMSDDMKAVVNDAVKNGMEIGNNYLIGIQKACESIAVAAVRTDSSAKRVANLISSVPEPADPAEESAPLDFAPEDLQSVSQAAMAYVAGGASQKDAWEKAVADMVKKNMNSPDLDTEY